MRSEPDVRESIERGWREAATTDEALERGQIDEAEWYRRSQQLVVPAYLAAETPYGQAGHSGDAVRWEQARRHVVDAVHRDGTFLDVGCANGILMETVHGWAAEEGLSIEPYGLDLSPELAALARTRLPHWVDRVFVGNALDWRPPRRFDFVRTGLEYVPRRRRAELIAHVLHEVVLPGGRIIVGSFNEERDETRRGPSQDEIVAGLGFEIGGRIERPHSDPRIVRRVFWLDAPP